MEKRMRKVIAMFLTFLLLCSAVTGYGMEAETEYAVSERTITVNGTAYNARAQKAAVYVMQPDCTFEDFDAQNPMKTMFYADTLETDEEGKFSFTFSLRATDKTGTYHIWIKSELEDMPTEPVTSFYFLNGEDSNAAFDDLVTSAKNDDIDAIKTFIETYTTEKPIIVLEEDAYYTENEDEILEILCNICEDGIDGAEDFTAKLEEAKALHRLNRVTDTAELDSVLTTYSAELGVVIDDDYTAKKDEILSVLLEKVNDGGFATGKELVDFYRCELAMLMVNNCTNTETMYESILKYADIFGLDAEEVEKYNSNSLSKTLLNTSYETPEIFANAVEDRMKELDDAEEESGSSGSSSSSGRGSGGGGGGSIILPNANIDMKVNSSVTNGGFIDMPADHWAYASVMKLKERGIMNGTPDGRCEPDRNITREEFVKLLVLAYGLHDSAATADFADCVRGAWYDSYIGSAVAKGIVNGVGDNRFGIGENITRQDMAAMIYRAATMMGTTFNEEGELAFHDAADIADYAATAVTALKNAGIISGMGDGSFAPAAYATRAQAAKMISELL